MPTNYVTKLPRVSHTFFIRVGSTHEKIGKSKIFPFLRNPPRGMVANLFIKDYVSRTFVAGKEASCEAEKLFENWKLGFPIGGHPRPFEPSSE